jgi:hypothetical protein
MHVHAEQPAEHGERQCDHRHERKQLHLLIEPIGHVREVRIENAGDAILEQERFLAQTHQVIVDVAEPVGELVGDERELTAREAADHIALRQHDAPQGIDVALQREDVTHHAAFRRLEHALFHAVEPGLELLHLRPVVIDHQVDDAVHQRDGPLGEDLAVPLTHGMHLLDRARLAIVHGHQVVRAEEEVRVVRREAMLRRAEIDAVEDQVDVAVVGLDLRVRHVGNRVFDGQRVKVEGLRQDPELFGRRGCKIHPQHHIAAGAKPFRRDRLHAFGDVLALEEDGNHSPKTPGCRLPAAACRHDRA